MGTLGTENVQGEEQKALDIIANDLFIKSVQQNGYVAGLTSEEMDDVIEVKEEKHQHGQYIVLFDPLDGSSNVNVNISVETIFSILNSENAHPTNADYLQAGTNQLCAGYALYGTSTMLVLTTGNGVNGFTLDKQSDTFYLTHPQMQVKVGFSCILSSAS